MQVQFPDQIFTIKNCPVQSKKSEKFRRLVALNSLWVPLLIFLRLLGLYHFRHGQDAFGYRKSWCNLWIINSVLLILACLWILFSEILAFDATHDINENAIYLLITRIAYHSSTIIFICSFFVASHSPAQLKCLYETWSQLRFSARHCESLEKKVKRRVWLIVIFTWSTTLICWSTFVLQDIQGFNFWHYHNFAHYLEQSIECFSIGFIVTICWSIYEVILSLNMWLPLIIQSPEFPSDLSEWRKFNSNYEICLQLISQTNDVLSFCIGCGLMSFLMQSMFVTSVYFSSQSTNLAVVVNSTLWTIYVYFATYITFWKAAGINAMIQDTLSHLGRARIAYFPVGLQNEFIFFQNRLSCNTIGISVFNVHLINRGMVSSIASVYATYLIILIQLKH